jgi:hypothetical protein
MKIISHRGNIEHPKYNLENQPDYILEAIHKGYDVEIDVRTKDNELFLGHDTPDYKIDISWLNKYRDNIWIHAKTFESLEILLDKNNLRIFYHQKEDHTIINNCNLIWSHDIKAATQKSIIPLLGIEDIKNFKYKPVHGICTDYANDLKNILTKFNI